VTVMPARRATRVLGAERKLMRCGPAHTSAHWRRVHPACTLMDVQEGADAVAGAVAVVEPYCPERQPRQRVQLIACTACVTTHQVTGEPGGPVVEDGNTAVASAMWPLSTRV
jgi:hypothetical protein